MIIYAYGKSLCTHWNPYWVQSHPYVYGLLRHLHPTLEQIVHRIVPGRNPYHCYSSIRSPQHYGLTFCVWKWSERN